MKAYTHDVYICNICGRVCAVKYNPSKSETKIPTVNHKTTHTHGQYSTYIETIYKESGDSVLDLPKIKYTRAYDVYICNICGGVCAVKFNQSQSNDGNTLLC